MPSRSHASRATALAAERHQIKHPMVVDSADTLDPGTQHTIHRYDIIDRTDANGSLLTVLLDENGDTLEMTVERQRAFNKAILHTIGFTPLPAASIRPNANTLTLRPGQEFDETITVTIPKSAGSKVADVYFLADTTGSMLKVLASVQAGASNIFAALSGLGADIAFGVGNYKDFASGDPYGFQHQANPTHTVAEVLNAINAWSASGGGDLPEAGLFALNSLAVAPGPGIGWRPGSKRIIVWFGDAPGHDPVCSSISGAPSVTEASGIANLVHQGITVLAISTAAPGLDGDPRVAAGGYVATCGPPEGTPGQATRIAAATGGKLAVGVNATTIVDTIISLVTGAVSQIKNVRLTPSPTIAPFVASISPASGYGPLYGDRTLTFDVRFVGPACRSTDQVANGSLDVIADGAIVAAKSVQIAVPACRFIYVVKVICGAQADCGCGCEPLAPGRYATVVSFHNYSRAPVDVVKRFVPLALAGAVIAREPNSVGVWGEDRISLPAQAATFDDCCRFAEVVLGEAPQASVPLTIGFLEITASAEIAVTAVYTTGAVDAVGGVSVEVVSFPARN